MRPQGLSLSQFRMDGGTSIRTQDMGIGHEQNLYSKTGSSFLSTVLNMRRKKRTKELKLISVDI